MNLNKIFESIDDYIDLKPEISEEKKDEECPIRKWDVKNISYDTSSEDDEEQLSQKDLGLPDRLVVKCREYEIADVISDETGYLVFDFEYEPLFKVNEAKKSDDSWDYSWNRNIPNNPHRFGINEKFYKFLKTEVEVDINRFINNEEYQKWVLWYLINMTEVNDLSYPRFVHSFDVG